jgi:hypothetical protein
VMAVNTSETDSFANSRSSTSHFTSYGRLKPWPVCELRKQPQVRHGTTPPEWWGAGVTDPASSDSARTAGSYRISRLWCTAYGSGGVMRVRRGPPR